MSYSLDANILLYASDTSSPFHAEAESFLQSCMSRRDLFYLSWPTIMAYLRIATHPSIFDEPLTLEDAMANVETLLNLPHCRCLSEEDGFWETWRTVTDETQVRGNLVPDAHLAALLRFHGVRRLYTHDRDFRRFDFLDVKDPVT
ncbi:MAG: PIN domain-containing protein [Gammaproteobacteria bacterium]|nr:PIN domain-containing protein [Gammaproteobacteria bacterium]MYK83009.1 PIN domain-containing protein [Gammaproteobacteria bacterium]